MAGGMVDGGCRLAEDRLGRRPAGSASDGDQLPMLAPRYPEPVADLPDCRVGPDRSEDRRHQVAVAASGRLEPVHGSGPGVDRAFGTNAPYPLDLAPLSVGIDLLE